jgi:hypothetical protein
MNYKLNTDKTAAVATEVFWMPIDYDTPVGVKMLVINQAHGIACICVRRTQDSWTHWAPLPKFKEEK